jgi:hypothetical protein
VRLFWQLLTHCSLLLLLAADPAVLVLGQQMVHVGHLLPTLSMHDAAKAACRYFCNATATACLYYELVQQQLLLLLLRCCV